MKTLVGSQLIWDVAGTSLGPASGTDGPPSAALAGWYVPKLTPQDRANGLSYRICGVSRFRCRDHISRPGCGRILLRSSGDVASANNASG